MSNISKISKRAKWILYGTAYLAVANFFAFWIIAINLGGDARNGYILNNHYFICAHGACKEVSTSIWNYSYWHTTSAMWGIFLISVEMTIFVIRRILNLSRDSARIIHDHS
jgi:hypothetical protein